MFKNLIEITLSTSAVILCLLFLSPLIKKSYVAKWRYFAWLFIAVRLIIPLNFTLPKAPITVTPLNQVAIYQNEIINNDISESPLFNGLETPQPKYVNIYDLLSVIWICGVFAFLFYQIFNYYRFKKAVKRWNDNVSDSRIIYAFNSMLSDMNIKRNIKIKLCKKVLSPMMFGYFKPTLLLPFEDYSDSDLTVILKHELIHYKRHDLWYKLVLLLANAMHWFNPLVYLMQRAANRDIELSCDDEVVKNTDVNFRKSYSETILNSLCNEKHYQTELSTYFHGSKRNLKDRFANILDMTKKKTGVLTLCAVLVISAAGGVFVACGNIGEANTKNDPIEKSTFENTVKEDTVTIDIYKENENATALVFHGFAEVSKNNLTNELIDILKNEYSIIADNIKIDGTTATINLNAGMLTKLDMGSTGSWILTNKLYKTLFSVENINTIHVLVDNKAGVEGNHFNFIKPMTREYLKTIENNFSNNESNDSRTNEYVKQLVKHVSKKFSEEFSDYYEILGYEINSPELEYEINENTISVTFLFKMKYKNFYKDPDTVDYIKEAKANSSKSYKILYDEYNKEQESNYNLKVTASILQDGNIDVNTIKIFNDISPKGKPEYVPIEGFFPKED